MEVSTPNVMKLGSCREVFFLPEWTTSRPVHLRAPTDQSP